jgi:hypothetical protein
MEPKEKKHTKGEGSRKEKRGHSSRHHEKTKSTPTEEKEKETTETDVNEEKGIENVAKVHKQLSETKRGILHSGHSPIHQV